MTKIKTFLEEEKNRFADEFGFVDSKNGEPINYIKGTLPPHKSIEDIILFLSQHDERLLAKVRETVEKKQKTCSHDSRSHCLEENCYIHEPNGYNEAIFDIFGILLFT